MCEPNTPKPDRRARALLELLAIAAAQDDRGGRITEADHARADQILLDLIADREVAQAFDRIGKWYA